MICENYLKCGLRPYGTRAGKGEKGRQLVKRVLNYILYIIYYILSNLFSIFCLSNFSSSFSVLIIFDSAYILTIAKNPPFPYHPKIIPPLLVPNSRIFGQKLASH